MERRAEKLKLDELYQGVTNKSEILDKLVEKYNLSYEEVAYVGDDINDMESVKKKVSIVLERNGGQGAVREAVEFVINQYNID